MASVLNRWYMLVRNLLVILCTVMVISGLVLLGLGAWIIYEAPALAYALGPFSAQFYISYSCFGMGAILFVTGVIGCRGAWKYNRCCLILFFFILTTLFIAEAVGTILVMVYREMVVLVVRQAGKQSLQKLYMGPAATDPISTAWNTVMTKFKCCGFENSTVDFQESAFSKSTGLLYPTTCCIRTTPACDGTSLDPDLIHPRSCFTEVILLIRKKSAVLGATAGTICILESGSMILTMLLRIKLGREQREERDE